MFDLEITAVNLRATDYGESDKILTLFSLERGLVTVSAKGVKKAKAKLKFAAEPFCFGKYQLAGTKRFVLAGCEFTELFYDLRTDIMKFSAAAVCAEFVLKSSGEEENPQLFLQLLKTLRELCEGTGHGASEGIGNREQGIGEDATKVLIDFLHKGLEYTGYKTEIKTLKGLKNYIEHTFQTKMKSLEGFLTLV